MKVMVRDSVDKRAVIDVEDYLGSKFRLEVIFFQSNKLRINYSISVNGKIEHASRKFSNYRNMPTTERILRQAKKKFPNMFVIREGLKMNVEGDRLFTDEIKDSLYFDFSDDRLGQLEVSSSFNSIRFSRFLQTKNTEFRRQYMLQDPFVLTINGEEHFLVGAERNLLIFNGWHLFTKAQILELLGKPVMRVTAGNKISDEVLFFFSQTDTYSGLAFLDEPSDEGRVRHYYYMEWDLTTNYFKLFGSHFTNLFSNPKLLRIRSLLLELHSNGFHNVNLDSAETRVELNISDSNLQQVVSLARTDFERWQLGASKVNVHDRNGNLVGFVKPLVYGSSSNYWGKWLVRKFNADGSYFEELSENAVYGVFQIVSGSEFVLRYRWKTLDSKSHWWATYRLGEKEPRYFARFHYFNHRELPKEITK